MFVLARTRKLFERNFYQVRQLLHGTWGCQQVLSFFLFESMWYQEIPGVVVVVAGGTRAVLGTVRESRPGGA